MNINVHVMLIVLEKPSDIKYRMRRVGVRIMKKGTIGILTAIMVFLFACANLVGCGDGETKQEALDKYTKITASFQEVGELISENPDVIDEAVVSGYQEMSNLLDQCTEVLESDQNLSNENYGKMIEWFDSVENWVKETKKGIEYLIAQAQ